MKIHSQNIKDEAARWAADSIHTQQNGIRVLDDLENSTARLLGCQHHSVEAYDVAGNAIYVNEGWQRLWGMQPHIMKEYNMLEDENLKTKVTWPAIKLGFSGTAGATPEASFTPEEIGFPGRHRWTDGYIAPVFNSADEIARIVLMLRDVTDTKLMMNEIARLRNDLQKLQFQYEAIAERLDTLSANESAGIRLNGLPPADELYQRAQGLSVREREVFRLLAADKSVKEIAFELNLGIKSIYTYRVRMMEKLGLASDMQVAAAYTIVCEMNERFRPAR